jgi:hypothetical protein
LAIHSLHHFYKIKDNVKLFCHLLVWLTLEPKPITQQSGQTPDNTTDNNNNNNNNNKINHITVGGGDYNETDPTCLLSMYNCLVCHNQKASFRADSLARHLLQFAYHASFGAMDKSSDEALLWDLTDNKHHNSSLKTKFWDNAREKFNATNEY